MDAGEIVLQSVRGCGQTRFELQDYCRSDSVCYSCKITAAVTVFAILVGNELVGLLSYTSRNPMSFCPSCVRIDPIFLNRLSSLDWECRAAPPESGLHWMVLNIFGLSFMLLVAMHLFHYKDPAALRGSAWTRTKAVHECSHGNALRLQGSGSTLIIQRNNGVSTSLTLDSSCGQLPKP